MQNNTKICWVAWQLAALIPLLLGGGGGGWRTSPLTVKGPRSPPPHQSAGVAGVAACSEWDGVVQGMLLPGAKGHGGMGHRTSLPIACMQGGWRTGPGNAVAWHKGKWRDWWGDILSWDSEFKKEAQIDDNFLNMLMRPLGPPVRIICSSHDKPWAN